MIRQKVANEMRVLCETVLCLFFPYFLTFYPMLKLTYKFMSVRWKQFLRLRSSYDQEIYGSNQKRNWYKVFHECCDEPLNLFTFIQLT